MSPGRCDTLSKLFLISQLNTAVKRAGFVTAKRMSPHNKALSPLHASFYPSFTMACSRPSPSVLQAFGSCRHPQSLSAEDRAKASWSTKAVLQPVDDVIEAEWVMEIQHRLLLLDNDKASGYRLAEPLTTHNGPLCS